MSFSARGASGTLKCGGRPAAILRDWSFTPTGDTWRVTATVVELDQFLVDSEYPKELRLDLTAETSWRFRNVSAGVGESSASITGTGAPEEL